MKTYQKNTLDVLAKEKEAMINKVSEIKTTLEYIDYRLRTIESQEALIVAVDDYLGMDSPNANDISPTKEILENYREEQKQELLTLQKALYLIKHKEEHILERIKGKVSTQLIRNIQNCLTLHKK